MATGVYGGLAIGKEGGAAGTAAAAVDKVIREFCRDTERREFLTGASLARRLGI